MNPLVSIIIPCYNYGRFLHEAIESALAQTYHPIEVIVINDGSTDNTIEVASKYPVILLNNKENQGAPKTFNKGVELARGDFCVILSADDKLHPSFIEKTMHVLQSNKDIAFVYTHTILFGVKEGFMYSREYDAESLKFSNYITGTALTRKSAILQTTGFDVELNCLEDWDLWLSFAEKGLYGQLLAEPLFYYRQQTLSRNISSPKIIRKALQKIFKKHHKTLYSKTSYFRRIITIWRFNIITIYLYKLINLLPKSIKDSILKLLQRLSLIGVITKESERKSTIEKP